MSSTAIPASKLLNSYIKDALAPVLIGAGFKATGRVYRRPAGDALQIVDIQNWKFNDTRRARFTLEVGVCFPKLLAGVAELESYSFYREALKKPGVTECAVRRRLGEFLDPPQDFWWTVSATTGHVPPVEEVTSPLTKAALPWMQSMSTLSALESTRSEQHALTNKVMGVAALFALGHKSLAADAAAALSKVRHPTQPELAKKLLGELVSLERLVSAHHGEA